MGTFIPVFSFLFFLVDDRIPLFDEGSLLFKTYHMIKVVPDSTVSKKIISSVQSLSHVQLFATA